MRDVPQSPEFVFVCPLPNGLHARPASHLSGLANNFASDCVLTNRRSGAVADAKSVLSLIAADVRRGDECTLRVVGADEEAARAALQRFVADDLPLCDEPLPDARAQRRGLALPRALQSAGANFYPGLAVSRGVGLGKVVIIGGLSLPRELNTEVADEPAREREKVERAVAAVRAHTEALLVRQTSVAGGAVLKAHLAILGDVSLADKLAALVAEGRSAGQAVVEAGEFFAAVLRRSESPYIRERAADVQEICRRLLEEIYGAGFRAPAVELNVPSVVAAESIAPQQLLSLERRWLEALVLERAGATSHAVILARALGVPTLVEVEGATRVLSPGGEVIVDAERGFVIPDPAPQTRRFYARELKTLERRRSALAVSASAPAVTADGRRLEVAANISSVEELVAAFGQGADGVGLFRTEMLFAGRDSAPPEEEQSDVYTRAVRAAGGRPVIIRTFDVGGDKPLTYLNLPQEANPFLGCRGVRVYAEHQEIFRAQLRAILRASAFGRVRLMIPMVSSLDEVLRVKAQLDAARSELQARRIAFDAGVPLGVMVEVPSAAFILERLCAELDFFSIGTNDLCQYFMAADRGNAKVSPVSDARHPGFIRFLRQVVGEIRARGKWVGMCGEMAGDARLLPLLLGLGLDEISVAASAIPALKKRVSELSAADCERLLARAADCGRAEEVEELLAHGESGEASRPLLERALVVLDSDGESKGEAIRELVDALYVAGRAEERERLEADLWEREAAYSTALGHGFAVPHCKSDAVSCDSIAVLRLKRPVDWAAPDGEPVRVVVLLAVKDAGGETAGRHMKVFAGLARRLMDEEFRRALLHAEDAEAVLSHLHPSV
jgi:fructose-specific PTS system IIA-like component